jgi:hypothetical protein
VLSTVVVPVMVAPVPWRVVPGVVLMVRRVRVPVSRRVVPRVVLVMRRRRVPVSRWVVPRVVMLMRRRRMLMPWRVVPRVMVVVGVRPVVIVMVVVGVRPVVIVMAPRGLAGRNAAVVEAQGMPLAGAVPGRLRPLGGRDAAGAAALPGARTAAPRIPRAALRPTRPTMVAAGDRDGCAARGCGRRDHDGLAARRRNGRRCRHAPVLRGRRRRRCGVHLDDRVDRPARKREHAASADRAQCDGGEGAIAREHREAEDGRRPHAARPREHGRAFL